MDKHQLEAEARQVLRACVKELKRAGNLPAGSLIVLGCSTSEVSGANIGKGSVPELGEIIARAMLEACAGTPDGRHGAVIAALRRLHVLSARRHQAVIRLLVD